jgi:hypothetical protein
VNSSARLLNCDVMYIPKLEHLVDIYIMFRSVRDRLAIDPEVRVRFPALSDFLEVVGLERGQVSL